MGWDFHSDSAYIPVAYRRFSDAESPEVSSSRQFSEMQVKKAEFADGVLRMGPGTGT